ncbi:hypothetical protein H0H93_001057, partial [Arthromyces matolae]
EDTIFPFHESKFGTNAMEHNIEQHHAFQPGFDVFQAYIKDILDGKAVYSGDLAIEKLDGFSETLVTHLHDNIYTGDPNYQIEQVSRNLHGGGYEDSWKVD